MVVVGLAAASAGAGTAALFSDAEQSTDNQVTAGTLDLTIDGRNGNATTTLDVDNATPGENGSATSLLANEGSTDGFVDVEIGPGNNTEGANPESETDTSPPGDLGDHLELRIFIDGDGDPNTTADRSLVADGTFNNVTGQDVEVNHPLGAGETAVLVVLWELPAGVGDEVQGDSSTVDLVVRLDQEQSQ